MAHHHHPKNDDTEILRTEKEILRVEQEILHELHDLKPHRLSQSSAVQFSGDFMANNVLVLNVGQTSTASPITFLADGVTPSGATYSAATYTFSDPSATVVLNPDGVTATVTGVAASTGPVTGSVTFTATDTDSVVSTWTQSFTVQTDAVTPPPPEQLSQSSAVTFSTPTP
jgi:hypothetical protein